MVPFRTKCKPPPPVVVIDYSLHFLKMHLETTKRLIMIVFCVEKKHFCQTQYYLYYFFLINLSYHFLSFDYILIISEMHFENNSSITVDTYLSNMHDNSSWKTKKRLQH